MNDDTLREECEALAKALIQTVDFTDDRSQRPPEMVAKLLAFARAQQAKGLEVAAVLCEREAMKALNEWRASRGESQAYGEEAFYANANAFAELGHRL